MVIDFLISNAAVLCGLAVGALVALVCKDVYRILISRLTLRSLTHRVGAVLYPRLAFERSLRYYIRPRCQSVDPAGGDEPKNIYAVSSALFTSVREALSPSNGQKYFLVLADSGMGKTSFLLNYYGYHTRRLRQEYALVVLPLSNDDVDKRIDAVECQDRCILFLDAFDEDQHAIENHVTRFETLIWKTRSFAKVVITCRTQFFPSDEEILAETGVMKIGPRDAGESAMHRVAKIYVSPFNDAEVRRFLRRRYPIWRFRQRRRARSIVDRMPDLAARPMLLAHVDDLVKSGRVAKYSFQVYGAMVDAWLEREQGWVNQKALREFSNVLAKDIFANRFSQQCERIVAGDAHAIAERLKIRLERWQISGRSLLNRDAEGRLKFSHRSIMEYLVATQAFSGETALWELEWTDQVVAFVAEMVLNYGSTTSGELVFLHNMHALASLRPTPGTRNNIDRVLRAVRALEIRYINRSNNREWILSLDEGIGRAWLMTVAAEHGLGPAPWLKIDVKPSRQHATLSGRVFGETDFPIEVGIVFTFDTTSKVIGTRISLAPSTVRDKLVDSGALTAVSSLNGTAREGPDIHRSEPPGTLSSGQLRLSAVPSASHVASPDGRVIVDSAPPFVIEGLLRAIDRQMSAGLRDRIARQPKSGRVRTGTVK